MKRRIMILTGAATVVGLLSWQLKVTSLADLPIVHAQTQDENSGCSLATLNGRYSLEGTGQIVGQLPGFPAPPLPLAEVALETYDGAGNLSGIATANAGGAVVPNFNVFGTYTVNRDCTGTKTVHLSSLGLTVHETIIVISGQRFISTETDPFAVIERKQERLGD